jgi:hypothetical protein
MSAPVHIVGVGVFTPHILPDGRHLSQRETAIVLQGPTEVHKWGLAKKTKKDWKAQQA